MKKSILEIYALSVCFVIALVIGVYDLIQIANPDFTLNPSVYERHQSNQAFGPSPRMEMRAINPAIPLEPTERSEEEITQARGASYQSALRAERRRGMQSLTLVAIIMMIDLGVFGVHWMLSKRARVTI